MANSIIFEFDTIIISSIIKLLMLTFLILATLTNNLGYQHS